MRTINIAFLFLIVLLITSCNKSGLQIYSKSNGSTWLNTSEPIVDHYEGFSSDPIITNNGDSTNPAEIKDESISREEAKLDTIIPYNFDKYNLCPIASEYLITNDTTFEEKYSDDALYSIGIKQDSALRFTDRFKDKIFDDITVGINISDVTKQLGQPTFSDEENSLIGYKTKDYYLFFHGKKIIDEISIRKRVNISDGYANLLVDFMKFIDHEDDYEGYDKFLEIYNQFYTKSHIRGGGWISKYPFGINFTIFDGVHVEVFNDFEGKLSQSTSVVTVDYINEDSNFNEEKDHYLWESYLQLDISDKGVLSPNKKVIAYSDNNSLYENAKVLVRHLDKSKADQYISVGYFADNLKWLSDRYILFTADYLGIFIYDINEGVTKLQEITKQFDSDKDDYREGELQTVDSDSITYLDKNNKLVRISYSFDQDGNIVLKRND